MKPSKGSSVSLSLSQDTHRPSGRQGHGVGATSFSISPRPGHPPGRVGFGSGQKKPGVFSSGPCPTRPGGRAVKLSPHPTRQPLGSGRVRVGSGSGRVGPGLCKMSGSFGFFGFRVKIFSPCPARQSYRVKNFDPSPPIKLFGSGRVGLFSGGLGRVRRVGQPMPRSSATNRDKRVGPFIPDAATWNQLSHIKSL